LLKCFKRKYLVFIRKLKRRFKKKENYSNQSSKRERLNMRLIMDYLLTRCGIKLMIMLKNSNRNLHKNSETN